MVLIGVIVMGWLWWQNKVSEEAIKNAPPRQDTTLVADSAANSLEDDAASTLEEERRKSLAETAPVEDLDLSDTTQAFARFGKKFAPYAQGEREFITIETDLYTAKISNRGASIYRWTLKKYNKWDGVPVQLVPYDSKGELFVEFLSLEGPTISSNDLYFDFGSSESSYIIGENDSLVITAKLEVEPGKMIKKTLVFYGGTYAIGHDITMIDMESLIASRYDLRWTKGLKYQEFNSVEESQEAIAVANLNGDPADVDATEVGAVTEDSYEGLIDYAAIKIKYFTIAIIPQPWQSFRGTVDMSGTRYQSKDEGVVETYDISLRVPYAGGEQTDRFRVYIGPLEYDRVNQYGLSDLVDFGWRYGIRQIGEYFIMPLLSFIHNFVPNYGISIIIFAFLMKLLLYPLSITQMRSARKMQVIAPEMQKIRDKYKDDNTKQQQEIMKLYSEYGVNPASGCLPLFLQMPILFALYSVLRRAIDLRQSEFLWWITDLSTPDKLIDFNFSILGISHISGLALLMGITMFFQQKLTVTDPRQKSMIYIMPVVFTLMFSHFPAGLNLYYFMFNLLSVAQQIYMNKFSKNKITLAQLKKAPKKKEGWIQKKMREAQEIAEAQGRSVPGKTDTKKLNQPNKRKKKK